MIGPLRAHRNGHGSVVITSRGRSIAFLKGDGRERERVSRLIDSKGVWHRTPFLLEADELLRRESAD